MPIRKLHYRTDYEIGQDNLRPIGLDLHYPVFPVSAGLVVLFVVATLVFPEAANAKMLALRGWAINTFDWLFLSGGNLFVLFCLVLVFLPYGRLRLGGPNAKPEFSLLSWLAMLFAAGMGIGLLFWSVAEPVAYYTDWFGTPLGVNPETGAAENLALGATIFHWGLHPWAIYAVVGLSLAYFSFNKGLPLTIRSTFYPLLGDRVWGWFGHFIDILAVVATIFGLATSLGFGATQAAGGLHFVFDTPEGVGMQMLIIVGVTLVALVSVVRGLDGGVKVLSNINMGIAFVFLAFVFFFGPTGEILGNLVNGTVSYVANIVPLSNPIGREDEAWMHGWTVFYWAWWISWSPFVGMFIARVSKGRTVRQFLIAVLLIPTAVTAFWMSAFGTTALSQVQAGVGGLADGISGGVELAMFQMLESLPLSSLMSVVGIVLVLVFFVTSSDSGSLVIDSITAGGKTNAPVQQRVFWAVMEGAIACALIAGGGVAALGALQAGAVSAGLPFTFVLLAMMVGLFLALKRDHAVIHKGAPLETANVVEFGSQEEASPEDSSEGGPKLS